MTYEEYRVYLSDSNNRMIANYNPTDATYDAIVKQLNFPHAIYYMDDILDWLCENLGFEAILDFENKFVNWNARWTFNCDTLYLKFPEDYILLKLTYNVTSVT